QLLAISLVDSTPSFTEIGTILRDALPDYEVGKGYGLPWATYVEEEFSKRYIVLDDTPDPWDWSAFSGRNWLAHTANAKKKMLLYKGS
ncbi:MAG TPA: hypothetical protein DD412_02555, partial [Holosporales bacterium]|nr:hypothetical protein [Holosporales bacterium]